jgi:hypothetical protein
MHPSLPPVALPSVAQRKSIKSWPAVRRMQPAKSCRVWSPWSTSYCLHTARTIVWYSAVSVPLTNAVAALQPKIWDG